MVLPIGAGLHAHVNQRLRVQHHILEQLRHAAGTAHHGLQHLQGANQAVACGMFVQRQNMARALATYYPAVRLQGFKHIAVAHFGAYQLYVLGL